MGDPLPKTSSTETAATLPPVTATGQTSEATTASDWSRTQAFTFAFSALTLVVNVLTGVLIARALGTTGRGELTAIMALPPTVAWIFGMGCFQAVSYHHAKHPQDGGQLISTWLVLLVPLAAVSMIAGYALVPAFFAAQTDTTKHLAQLFLLIVILQLLSEVFFGVLLGDHDFLLYNVLRFAQPAVIGLVYVVLWQLDEISVSSALLATFLVGLAFSVFMTVRILRRHPLARPSWRLMRSTLWYGIRAHGTNIGGLINGRLDLLIIPAFLTASSVGLYAVAMAASSIIPTIAGALSALVLPAAARQGKQGVHTVIRSLHVTFAVALFLSVGLAALADPAISLVYGSAFDGSALPLRLLLPGTVLYTVAAVLWSGLYAANRPLTASVAQGLGVIVTVVGLLLFLRSGGVTAAALVTTVSYTVVFVMALTLYRRAVALRWSDFLPGRQPTSEGLPQKAQPNAVVSS